MATWLQVDENLDGTFEEIANEPDTTRNWDNTTLGPVQDDPHSEIGYETEAYKLLVNQDAAPGMMTLMAYLNLFYSLAYLAFFACQTTAYNSITDTFMLIGVALMMTMNAGPLGVIIFSIVAEESIYAPRLSLFFGSTQLMHIAWIYAYWAVLLCLFLDLFVAGPTAQSIVAFTGLVGLYVGTLIVLL